MTRWSLFIQTLSLLLHHFLGLYSGAVSYSVIVRDQSGTLVATEVMNTPGPYFISLEPGDYSLSIEAFNGQGAKIGQLMVSYEDGWARAYLFRTA